MPVKTAVGAADDEEREPDLIGTVRWETDDEGYSATWVKVGRAVTWGYTGFHSDEQPIVMDDWLCIHSSEMKAHGKRARNEDVASFPIVGAVPNTPAHTQRLIKATREMHGTMAQRLRKVTFRPSGAIIASVRDKRRRMEER